MKKYSAQVHWAKLEVPRTADGSIDEMKLDHIREHLRTSFPMDDFNAYRKKMDPENVLSNNFIDFLFADSPVSNKNRQEQP
jgi:L-galactono-1,4-lactone dehydrogenase